MRLVPNGVTAGDDGCVMGLVIDRARKSAELVILDTTLFEHDPQAHVTIATRVPPDFCGNGIHARWGVAQARPMQSASRAVGRPAIAPCSARRVARPEPDAGRPNIGLTIVKPGRRAVIRMS
jgi:hypothetical protein